MSARLGTDFRCMDDVDARFRVTSTDEEVALQDVYHRITTDSVLGIDDETGELTPAAADFGLDVRKLLGAPMTDLDILGLGPRLSMVVQRSGRIGVADVVVTRDPAATPPILTLLISVTGTLATGASFAFVFRATAATVKDIGQE